MPSNKQLESCLLSCIKLREFFLSSSSSIQQICSSQFEHKLIKLADQCLSKCDTDGVCMVLQVIKYLAEQNHQQGIYKLLNSGLCNILDKILHHSHNALNNASQLFDCENILKHYFESFLKIVPLQNDQSAWFKMQILILLKIVLRSYLLLNVSQMVVDSMIQISQSLNRVEAFSVRSVVCNCKESLDICKVLILRLDEIGDYMVQSNLIELVFRLIPGKIRVDLAVEWNRDKTLTELFKSISYQEFDQRVRLYLNAVNVNQDHLWSVSVDHVMLGNNVYTDHCWLDLCLRSSKVGISFAGPDDDGTLVCESLDRSCVGQFTFNDKGNAVELVLQTLVSLKVIFDEDIVSEDAHVIRMRMSKDRLDANRLSSVLSSILLTRKPRNQSKKSLPADRTVPCSTLKENKFSEPPASTSPNCQKFSQDLVPSSFPGSCKESKEISAVQIPVGDGRHAKHALRRLELQKVKVQVSESINRSGTCSASKARGAEKISRPSNDDQNFCREIVPETQCTADDVDPCDSLRLSQLESQPHQSGSSKKSLPIDVACKPTQQTPRPKRAPKSHSSRIAAPGLKSQPYKQAEEDNAPAPQLSKVGPSSPDDGVVGNSQLTAMCVRDLDAPEDVAVVPPTKLRRSRRLLPHNVSSVRSSSDVLDNHDSDENRAGETKKANDVTKKSKPQLEIPKKSSVKVTTKLPRKTKVPHSPRKVNQNLMVSTGPGGDGGLKRPSEAAARKEKKSKPPSHRPRRKRHLTAEDVAARIVKEDSDKYENQLLASEGRFRKSCVEEEQEEEQQPPIPSRTRNRSDCDVSTASHRRSKSTLDEVGMRVDEISSSKKLRFSDDPYEFQEKEGVEVKNSSFKKKGKRHPWKRRVLDSSFSAASATSELSWVRSHRKKSGSKMSPHANKKPLRKFEPKRKRVTKEDKGRESVIKAVLSSPEVPREAVDAIPAEPATVGAPDFDTICRDSSSGPDDTNHDLDQSKISSAVEECLVQFPACFNKSLPPSATPINSPYSSLTQCSHISTIRTPHILPTMVAEPPSSPDKDPDEAWDFPLNSVRGDSSKDTPNPMQKLNNKTPSASRPQRRPSCREQPNPPQPAINSSSSKSSKRLKFKGLNKCKAQKISRVEKDEVAKPPELNRKRGGSLPQVVSAIERNIEEVEKAWGQLTRNRNSKLSEFEQHLRHATTEHDAIMRQLVAAEKESIKQLKMRSHEFDSMLGQATDLAAGMARYNETFHVARQTDDDKFNTMMSALSRQVSEDLNKLMRVPQ